MAGTAVKILTLLKSRGIAPLLKAVFPADAAAPLGTSPVAYGPEAGGVGALRLEQQDGVAEWLISGGVLKLSASPTSGFPLMSTAAPFARAVGLAFRHRTAQEATGSSGAVTASPICGWSTQNSGWQAEATSGLWWYTAASAFIADDKASGQIYDLLVPVTGEFYTCTHILRAAGSFAVIGDRLLAPLVNGSDANVYPVVAQSSTNRHTPMVDWALVAQLGGPWLDSYGIATTRLAGARAANDTFTHEAANHWVEFTLAALPSSGNIDIEFRRVDANNCWKLQVTSAGAFNLIEVVSGTPTTRANIASNQAGDRLLCCFDGANARLNRQRAGANIPSSVYGNVSTFTTQTGGVVASLGTGGAISDLITWPRVLSGDALAWIEALTP